MKDYLMPRAQKHAAATRYQLEKLRLDVALKRSRLNLSLRASNRPIPQHERPAPRDAEIDAIYAERKAVEREIRLIYARKRLGNRQEELARDRDAEAKRD